MWAETLLLGVRGLIQKKTGKCITWVESVEWSNNRCKREMYWSRWLSGSRSSRKLLDNALTCSNETALLVPLWPWSEAELQPQTHFRQMYRKFLLRGAHLRRVKTWQDERHSYLECSQGWIQYWRSGNMSKTFLVPSPSAPLSSSTSFLPLSFPFVSFPSFSKLLQLLSSILNIFTFLPPSHLLPLFEEDPGCNR